MIDPATLKRDLRLTALEYTVARILAAMSAQLSDQDFQTLINGYRADAEALTIPDLDAVQPDLAASEFHYALIHILNLAKELRTSVG
jgi:hypothetical protein